MKPIIKYLIGLWIVLFVAMGLLLYNAYSKLRPEIFISLLTEQVQKNYPGTTLEVGRVDYRLSVDFNMGLKDLVLKRSGQLIGSLAEIEVRLPWWLLLFEQGNAQINLSKLIIYIDNKKDHVQAGSQNSKQSPLLPASKKVSLSLPDYLTKAQFTLRAKDVTVMELGTSRRYFTLNKLLVREFQFGKNSAFELNLPITMSHNEIVYDSELWLFGDVTPDKEIWDLKFRGEFRTSDTAEKFQLEDLIIDGKAKLKPHELGVSSKLSFVIEKEVIGTGVFEAGDKDFAINLNFSKFPLSFLGLFEKEISNPYFPKLDERAEGKVGIKKTYQDESVRLDGYLEFPGAFKLSDTNVEGKWRISFNDAKWETSFISPKGEVSFFRRSVIDFAQGKVTQFVEELGFSEVDFLSAIQLVSPLSNLLNADAREYSSTSISFKKCKLGEKVFDGSFRYGISPDQRFYLTELTEGTGSLKLNFQQIAARKKLSLELVKFPWIDGYAFLRPYFQSESGVVNGTLEGRWGEQLRSGQWKVNLKAEGLQSASGEWVTFIKEFWKNFAIDSRPVPDQSWAFSLNERVLNVESLLLAGGDPAKITGQVDTNFKKKSFLVLSYPKNRKWKPVRKEITGPFWKKE